MRWYITFWIGFALAGFIYNAESREQKFDYLLIINGQYIGSFQDCEQAFLYSDYMFPSPFNDKRCLFREFINVPKYHVDLNINIKDIRDGKGKRKKTNDDHSGRTER
jgi:hypothetical protein